jgi:pyruvate formate lyase activating enzyme
MRRREFMQTAAVGAGLLMCPRVVFSESQTLPENAKTTSDDYRRPARFYTKLENDIVECQLCPRKCRVSDLERGYCGVRENIGGEYHTLVHSRVCSANIDPIEKKPFFHFLPGTLAFSVATAGCNLNCKFCQNWSISQFRPEDVASFKLTPEDCVLSARKNECVSLAYTYSEPTIFYEYMSDCAAAGRKSGLRSVVVSAGYIQKEPLGQLLPLVDAIKIDLKAFDDRYYRDICRGELKPVLETLVKIKESGKWLEIVYLMVPSLNDKKEDIAALSIWIKNNLGPDVPIHFTRFHPMYLLQNLPITPLGSLEQAYNISREKGLNYVYIGNVNGHDKEKTYCHSCGKLLIDRQGFEISVNVIKLGRCPYCENLIPGIWS